MNFKDLTLNEQLRFWVDRFISEFPEDSTKARQLFAQIDDPEIGNRSNTTGHVTASMMVVNHARTKVLLIDHKLLNRRITPGGHYEGDVGLYEAAMREAYEETGVAEIEPGEIDIIDIDTHPIPYNPRKNEAEHRHHDLMFFGIADDTIALNAQREEVDSAVWVDLDAVSDPRTIEIIKRLTKADLL